MPWFLLSPGISILDSGILFSIHPAATPNPESAENRLAAGVGRARRWLPRSMGHHPTLPPPARLRIPANGSYSRIGVRALTRLGVPTPGFVGFHPDAQVLVLERKPGRGDFHNLKDLDRRDRLGRRFVEVLADLHRHRPSDFHLDATMPVPVTDEDHALGELRIAERSEEH